MSAPSVEEHFSAYRRSDQAFHAQLAEPVSLPCGLAYCAGAFAALPDANQVREVLLLDLSMADAAAAVRAHFAAAGRTCLRWSLAAEQPPAAAESALPPAQWTRYERRAFGYLDRAAFDLSAPPQPRPPDLRILPARAMRRAFAGTFQPDCEPTRMRVEAAQSRMNDSNYDVFVAVRGGAPAGRVALLEVGDICRIEDLYVMPAFRRQGVAAELLRFVLRLAYRLRPRAIVTGLTRPSPVAGTPEEPSRAWQELLTRHGFVEVGRLHEWEYRAD